MCSVIMPIIMRERLGLSWTVADCQCVTANNSCVVNSLPLMWCNPKERSVSLQRVDGSGVLKQLKVQYTVSDTLQLTHATDSCNRFSLHVLLYPIRKWCFCWLCKWKEDLNRGVTSVGFALNVTKLICWKWTNYYPWCFELHLRKTSHAQAANTKIRFFSAFL